MLWLLSLDESFRMAWNVTSYVTRLQVSIAGVLLCIPRMCRRKHRVTKISQAIFTILRNYIFFIFCLQICVGVLFIHVFDGLGLNVSSTLLLVYCSYRKNSRRNLFVNISAKTNKTTQTKWIQHLFGEKSKILERNW